MTSEKKPTIIKKYANRRLYNTGTSTYVTLDDLGTMVRAGEDFIVKDAKTDEDITRSVLTQVIFEEENKGQTLLPVTFLRQLIGFYGDSMQALVPTYLEFSMENLAREQQKIRDQMSTSFSPKAFQNIEGHVRANMTMFQDAMRMFLPFAMPFKGETKSPEATKENSNNMPKTEHHGKDTARNELEELKYQMAEMKAQLEAISNKKT